MENREYRILPFVKEKKTFVFLTFAYFYKKKLKRRVRDGSEGSLKTFYLILTFEPKNVCMCIHMYIIYTHISVSMYT